MSSEVDMYGARGGVPPDIPEWNMELARIIPEGVDFSSAIQRGLITAENIIDMLDRMPDDKKWESQQEIIAMIEEIDDITGELICQLIFYMQEKKSYTKDMTEAEFLESYQSLVERAELHQRKRDKRIDHARVIRKNWDHAWVTGWLVDMQGSRSILKALRDVTRLCDFGTAVLLVNEATLQRIQLAKTTGRGRGKRTGVQVRAEDWEAVKRVLLGGHVAPALTEEALLVHHMARLGKYYLVEPESGRGEGVIKCMEAWELALQASLEEKVTHQSSASGRRTPESMGTERPEERDLLDRDQEMADAPSEVGNVSDGGAGSEGDGNPSDGGAGSEDEFLPEEAAAMDNPGQDKKMGQAKTCGCSKGISDGLKTRMLTTKVGKLKDDFAVLGQALKAGEICYRHLLGLGGRMGLVVNKLGATQLREKLEWLLDNRLKIGELKTSPTTYSMFRRKNRPPRTADAIGTYAFNVREESEGIKVNEEAILGRFKPGIREEFDRNGSVNVAVFDWIFEDAELARMVDLEFWCYLWHLRKVNGRDNYGWSRAMVHSLSQQLIRQDPVYYSLYVALRPDHCTELVSYPYYAKFAVPGDNTHFRHIDVDITRMLETGRGANMIQGTVSFSDEDDTNCTEVALGLHHHMEEWYALLVERKLVVHDFVARITEAHYTKEDAVAFGLPYYVRVPCRAGDVRITLPHLPHGQNGQATKVRKTLFPWYVAIQKDGSIETDEAGTWDELSKSHRNLDNPPATPSGFANKYGKIPFRFPAATELRGLGPLSDALIAQREWKSPAVQAEAIFLLDGLSPTEEVERWIRRWRRRAARAFKDSFRIFEASEVSAFKGTSFFEHMDGRIEPDFSHRPDIDHGDAEPTGHPTVDESGDDGSSSGSGTSSEDDAEL